MTTFSELSEEVLRITNTELQNAGFSKYELDPPSVTFESDPSVMQIVVFAGHTLVDSIPELQKADMGFTYLREATTEKQLVDVTDVQLLEDEPNDEELLRAYKEKLKICKGKLDKLGVEILRSLSDNFRDF